jgi:transcriptional regulator with XRE-family HTH domain
VINEYSNHSDVHSDHHEDLADYVLRVMREDDVSLRKIADRAEQKGYKIAQSYLSKIISGAAQNLSVEKLQALAAGLNRPEEEVFAIARGERLQDELITDALAKALLLKWAKITKKDKEELASLLRMLNDELDRRLRK